MGCLHGVRILVTKAPKANCIRTVTPRAYGREIPVMAAVAVRQKVVIIGHFSPSFYLQSLQSFLFVRLNQEQLYVLIALKNRTKPNELDELKYHKNLTRLCYAFMHAQIKT